MKRFFLILVGLGLMAGQVSGQSEVGNGKAKLLPSTQAVLNSAVNHPELMVITGRIVDAETFQAINDAKINFDKFGDELVNAAIDKDGNYALAISKKEVGDQVRIIFKIEGYQKYIAKSVRTNASVVDLDLYLRADESKQVSTANVKYALGDDPFNTLVIKF
jgi:hypothetical protein